MMREKESRLTSILILTGMVIIAGLLTYKIYQSAQNSPSRQNSQRDAQRQYYQSLDKSRTYKP